MRNIDARLINAAIDGDLTKVRELIDRGANIDAINTYENTSLILAARFGHAEVVRELVDRGANIDARSTYGNTSLMLAAGFGHAEVVRELVDRGANINAVNTGGNTSLILAAYFGNIEVVRELIDRGVDIDAMNTCGNTSLIFAVENGHVGTVRELIFRGANIYLKNNDGKTALDIARRKGFREIETIIEDMDIFKLVEIGDMKGLRNVFEKIKERGNMKHFEYENEVNNDGKTPLMRALENKQDYLAVYQIINGASLSCEDNYGKSVFRYILENKSLGILKLCIEKELDEDYIINVLIDRKVNGDKGIDRSLNMINLRDDNNIKVINELIKKGAISDDAMKILQDNGLETNNINKWAKIWLDRGIKDDENISEMIDKLLQKYKDIKRKIIRGKINRIEVLKEKDESSKIDKSYKIIVREKDNVYKMYMCKKCKSRYTFNEKAKNSPRPWVIKKIRRVKKVCRCIVMKKMDYMIGGKLDRAKIERENVKTNEKDKLDKGILAKF